MTEERLDLPKGGRRNRRDVRLERRYRDSRFTADEIKELRNGAEFKEHLDYIFEIIEKPTRNPPQG